MQNHQGRSVNRPLNRRSLLASIERLESRCVLSAAPGMGYNFGAPGPDDLGQPAAIGAPQHGQQAPPPKIVHESGPLNYSTYETYEVGTYLIKGPNYTEMVIVTATTNGTGRNFVNAYAVILGDNNYPEPVHASDPPKGGSSHPTPPSINPGAIAAQSAELLSHSITQTTTDPAANVVIAALPPVAKLPLVSAVNQAVASAAHQAGFVYTSGIIGPAASAIVADMPIVQELFQAGLKAAANIQEQIAGHKISDIKLVQADDVANWPVQKASMASLPLNISSVEHALEKVMGELGHLGTAFSSWLDARHLTGAAVAVSVITIGGGTAIYLRRRGGKHARKRDDEEASSSWLFARLQSAPDAT
jgi:hypothetical protein